MSASYLRGRYTFQKNVAAPDWSGHPPAPEWEDQFTVWGNIQFMRGGESVISARLTARQPAILTIRNSEQARCIEADWRLKDARSGELFNIREKPRASRDNRNFLEVLVEAGASDG